MKLVYDRVDNVTDEVALRIDAVARHPGGIRCLYPGCEGAAGFRTFKFVKLHVMQHRMKKHAAPAYDFSYPFIPKHYYQMSSPPAPGPGMDASFPEPLHEACGDAAAALAAARAQLLQADAAAAAPVSPSASLGSLSPSYASEGAGAGVGAPAPQSSLSSSAAALTAEKPATSPPAEEETAAAPQGDRSSAASHEASATTPCVTASPVHEASATTPCVTASPVHEAASTVDTVSGEGEAEDPSAPEADAETAAEQPPLNPFATAMGGNDIDIDSAMPAAVSSVTATSSRRSSPSLAERRASGVITGMMRRHQYETSPICSYCARSVRPTLFRAHVKHCRELFRRCLLRAFLPPAKYDFPPPAVDFTQSPEALEAHNAAALALHKRTNIECPACGQFFQVWAPPNAPSAYRRHEVVCLGPVAASKPKAKLTRRPRLQAP